MWSCFVLFSPLLIDVSLPVLADFAFAQQRCGPSLDFVYGLVDRQSAAVRRNSALSSSPRRKSVSAASSRFSPVQREASVEINISSGHSREYITDYQAGAVFDSELPSLLRRRLGCLGQHTLRDSSIRNENLNVFLPSSATLSLFASLIAVTGRTR